MDTELERLRAQLADVDAKLLELVAERARLAAAVGKTKQDTGRATRDFGQEREVLERARAMSNPAITFVHGDGLTHGFEPESFDAVVSVASTHHVDLEVALTRMSELVRPGGVVAVVGLGSISTVGDLWFDGVGFIATRILHRTRHAVEVNAPIVWPPPLSHRQSRAIARDVLPGVEDRRRILFRHTLRWTKPA